MNRHRQRNNRGVAMIVAIIVAMVVMVFALALLLAAYSLFASVNKDNLQEQCKALAKSVSAELDAELTGDDVQFQSYEEQANALLGAQNNLWFYLRCNIRQSADWTYYNEDEESQGHTYEAATKSYTLTSSDTDKTAAMADSVKVLITWESDAASLATNDAKSANTVLYIKVTADKADASYTLTSVYDLTIDDYEAGNLSQETVTIADAQINPRGHSIIKNEKWIWELQDKE